MLVAQRGFVPLTNGVEPGQRCQDQAIVGVIVGNQEVDSLGSANEAIRDHRESADHDEAGAGRHHRAGGDVELRVEC